MKILLIDREIVTHDNDINLQANKNESVLARTLKNVYSFPGLEKPVWANVMRKDCFRN